ncbi:MAG: di-trans,poly-cis-decaprenylcistransferase [Synergistaceae bacterium]|nr:di-trans,poly-cis-decaprenylcistransferase [Synergistaceae bacterium]
MPIDGGSAKIPAHIGIIMDGNRRWAKKRGLPAIAGHRAGMKALEKIIDNANEFGVKYLSLYAFSTENWKRNPLEVEGLMGLFRLYLKDKVERLCARGARIRFVGKMDAFDGDIREGVREAEEKTVRNGAIEVIICVNYGGRQEIVDAVNRLIAERMESPVTEDAVRSKLYAPDIPDPDLIIRTGGELRMSNFWLWEGAYSEYYFTDAYWPEFGGKELQLAISSFSERERRYGAT